MPDEGGFIEFFEMLTEYDSLDSFRKAQEQLNDFRSSNEDERILKTVRKIELFNQERLLVTMVGRFGLVADEGDLQPWLRNLVFQLPMGRFPRLAICSSRMVRGEFRESYPNVVFQPVRNLFEEHARDLLTLWFNLLQLNATEQNIRDVIAITGGRPYAIRRAAQLANEHGLDMVLERHQLRRLLSLGYESTIQQIKSQLDKAITALLLHFERLSLSDLVLAANKAINDIADSIANLMANMIVENEADYYFVAPHLIDILSRENWLSDYDVLCKNASSALIEKIKQFEPDEYISVASLNAAVIGAIHRNELLPSQLVNLVKPAQLLRVGKHLYDHGRYTRSSEILGKALEIHQELTIDAIIEGLRLRAMCLARLYHEQPAQQSEFHKIVERLNDIQTTKAKQSRCFVLGFQARISGHLEKAHKHYRQAIRDYRGDRNFHVLNEYSKVLLRLHEYDDALRYARLALEIAPTNPYVLEVVITALIERHKRLSEDNGDEINKLLGDLEVASARMDTCHYQCCSSRYQLKIGNVHEALELADAAVKFIKDKPGNIDSDMTFQAHFTRAQCLFKSKRYKDMETNLYELEKKISEQRDFRRFSTSVLQLRIQQLMRLNDFDRARATINRAIGVSYIDRNRLKEELDREEAYASKLN